MRTRKLALTGAATAILASLAAGASPALAVSKPSCSAGSTLAISKSARVFVVKTGHVRRVYGCATGSGKARYFGRVGGESVDTSVIAVTGPRVAYVLTSCSETGCQQTVLVYDLKKRKEVSFSAAAPADVDQQVTDILLARDGTVAWIGEEQASGSAATARFVLARTPGKPPATLASGLDIVPGSLALAGTTLYWTQGTARSAPLP